MAEISLSVYQRKLDNLLGQDKFNEVIAHCRHILKAHPKNIKAYSQLGQALVAASRWEEAAEVFRRLLGSSPHDFLAHYQLSEVYQHMKQYDDAIWHAERAYDQQPNNAEVIERIRTLYREHRGKEVKRLQLTAGAVAQQHIRNALYPQAIGVLDKALQRYPNRIDLQILRARAQWLMGKQLDAAETAVDILSILPYSMTANRILTDLWLAEQRPSDAQRYLSRIEELDPYLAYRLATGENPPDSLLEIEELDYEVISRRELTSANPDWLSTIGSMPAVEDDDDALDFDEGDLDDGDMDDLDLDFLDEMESADSPTPMKVTDDLDNLLSDEWQERVDALDDGGESAISDDDLDDLFGDDGDLDDLLGDADDEVDLDDLFGDADDGDLDDLLGDTDDEADLDDLFADADDSDLDDLFGDVDDPVATDEVDFDDLFADVPDDELFGDLDDEPAPEARLSTDELNLPEGMHTDDLPDGLLDRIEKMKGASQDETMPAANKQEIQTGTGLTGLLSTLGEDEQDEDLSWLVEAQKSNVDTGELTLPPEFDDQIPDDPNAQDSDWLEELEAIESSPDANRASTGLTGMLDDDEDEMVDLFADEDELNALLDEDPQAQQNINPDDPDAWMIASGIEFDADAEKSSPFDFEDEDDVGIASAEVDPMAWLNDDSDTDDEPDTSDDIPANDELDPMAWMQEEGIAPVGSTDDLADDAQAMAESNMPQFFDDFDEDDPLATNDLDGQDAPDMPDDLFGDEDMLDEMLSLEDDDMDFSFDEPDDNNDFSFDEPSLADDGDELDFGTEDDDTSDDIDLDFLTDDDMAFDSASVSEDGQDMMSDDFNNDWQDDTPDDELDPMAWMNDDDAGEDEEVDLEDMFADLSDNDIEADDSGLEWLQADELAESAEDVDLSVESEEADELDPMAWMSEADVDLEGDEAEPDPMAWMQEEGVELDEDEDDADPMAWMQDEGVELAGAAAAGAGAAALFNALDDDDSDDDDDPMMNLFDDDEPEDIEEDTGHWLDNINLEETGPNEAVSEPEPEADWLSEIEDDGEFSDDSAEIDWMADDVADSTNFEGDDSADDLFNFEDDDEESEEFQFDTSQMEAMADEPDWLTDLDTAQNEAINLDDEADDEADWLSAGDEFASEEEDEAVMEQPDWLSEMNESSDTDDADDDDVDDFLSDMDFDDEDEDDIEELEQPDWLSDVSRDEDGVDDADDAEEVDSTDDWLSDLGEFSDGDDEFVVTDDAGEPIAEDDDDGWLDDGAKLAGAAAAGAGAAALFNALDDDDDEPIAEANDADWLADMGDFEDEQDDEPTSVTDELDWMAEDDDDEPVAEANDADWLADMGDFEDEDEPVAEAQSVDWLGADFDDDDDEQDMPKSVTSELDWMEEDDYSAETEVGASADVDYLDNVDPATAESALDWMTDADDDDELILDDIEEEPQGITDWLTGDDDDELDTVAEGDAGDWLADIGGFESDESAMAMAQNDDDGSDKDDWLADIGGYEDDDEPAEEASPDWLSGMPDADDEFDYEDDDTLVGFSLDDADDDESEDEPDWLAGMEEGDGVQDAFDESAEDEFDWGDDSDDLVEHAQAEDEPDWLAGMGLGDGVQDAFGEETAENSGALAGLSDINDYETKDELDVTYEEEDLPTFEESVAETQPSSGLDDFEEELEHTPADSAPDWLNAMVPGLDNNFEIQDDDPLDEVLLDDDEDTRKPDKGFDWLSDIVDEETGAMAPVVPKPPPPSTSAPTRWKFSKRPAWVDKLLGGATLGGMLGTSQTADTVKDDDDMDFDFDDDDDEFPDWLDIDDD